MSPLNALPMTKSMAIRKVSHGFEPRRRPLQGLLTIEGAGAVVLLYPVGVAA